MTGLPGMVYLTGLVVYRSQATGYVGGAVVCGCDDGNFHCYSINRKGAKALRFYLSQSRQDAKFVKVRC